MRAGSAGGPRGGVRLWRLHSADVGGEQLERHAARGAQELRDLYS